MRGKAAFLLLLGAGAGLAGEGAGETRPPAVEREIAVAAAGRVAVRLDRDVYEAARADLGDLRIVGGDGREVAYVIDRPEHGGPSPDVRPETRNRGWLADGAATAVLDFGGRAPRRRLELRLTGDNFRRRVAVSGSDDGASWTTLVEEAWVFAVPGPQPFRWEAVDLPENDFPRLRLVVHPSADERARPAIEDAWVPGDGRGPRPTELLSPRFTEAQETRARETWLTVDLGARHQPFEALDLAVADGRFLREVRVEARRERPGGLLWEEIGRGVVHRVPKGERAAGGGPAGARVRERLSLEVRGRERVLRLRIRNLDDRPLRVLGVSVRVPVERLLFDAAVPGAHRLTYGVKDRTAPVYDLVRTVADPAAWGTAAREVSLGPPGRREGAPGPEPPWTERHPEALWASLLAVVAALGILTWRALGRAA